MRGLQLFSHAQVYQHVEHHVEQYHEYLGNGQIKDNHNKDNCSEDDHNRVQNHRK